MIDMAEPAIPLTIIVFYSCALCGLRRVPVTVPARAAEDVLDWMAVTVRRVSDDHHTRSPHCRPATLTDLLIPASGTDRIGGPAIN